jgi:hypothetical protein
MLEALVVRHGAAFVTRVRRDLQGAMRDVRRGFLLRDERIYQASLLELEALAASVGALGIVRICRSLESQPEGSLAAAGLDRLHWETERVLEALRPAPATQGEATQRRRRDRTGRFTARDPNRPGSLPPA